MGWQELVIVAFMLSIYGGIPASVVAIASTRRTGSVQTGWVVASFVFSWLGLVAWANFGGGERRA